MNNAKDEIRARLNIEDLVSEYVELKRAGRNFKGLSPWTNEKSPSFVVSPEKQIWHDFSSGKGGDIFSFIMEVEGLGFREALELLARKTGVELEKFNSEKSAKIASEKKRYKEVLALSQNFFQHCLVRNKAALNYVFKDRKLSKEIVQNFGIGYAPSGGSDLVNYLQKKKFSKKDLAGAGLLNRFDGDIFRSRMVIPLQDVSGETVGFTGRILIDDPKAPKYLNTPQTLLYDKSSHVFGLSQAKNAIRKNDFAVVVEGNMDVISSHQVGVKNVVATAGTALTEQHLKAISRFSGDIRLCFDADKAGINATERAIILAQNVGVEVSIISLSQESGEAKDPDELIQKDVKLWEKSIENPQAAVDWVLDQYEKRFDISSASGKRKFSTMSLKLVENLHDPVEKEHYLDEISKRINTSRQALLAKFSEEKSQPKPKKHMKVEKTNANMNLDDFIYEDDILALALRNKMARESLLNLEKNSLHSEVRNVILENIKSGEKEKLKKNENYVKILLLKGDERYSGWTDTDLAREMERLINKVKTQNLTNQKELLQSQLKDAEIQGEDEKVIEILAKITKLNKEINGGKS